MKLSNRELLNSLSGLRSLSQKELPIKLSYAIAKNLKAIEKELVIYEKERHKLVKKYAKLDKEGNPQIDEYKNYIIKEENALDWQNDIKELLDIIVDLNIHKVNLNALEGVKISPSKLGTIDFMLDE